MLKKTNNSLKWEPKAGRFEKGLLFLLTGSLIFFEENDYLIRKVHCSFSFGYKSSIFSVKGLRYDNGPNQFYRCRRKITYRRDRTYEVRLQQHLPLHWGQIDGANLSEPEGTGICMPRAPFRFLENGRTDIDSFV